ncbi:MAG: hypothetical protein ACI4PV_07735, partial [Butyricicoccus sp.]
IKEKTGFAILRRFLMRKVPENRMFQKRVVQNAGRGGFLFRKARRFCLKLLQSSQKAGRIVIGLETKLTACPGRKKYNPIIKELPATCKKKPKKREKERRQINMGRIQRENQSLPEYIIRR